MKTEIRHMSDKQTKLNHPKNQGNTTHTFHMHSSYTCQPDISLHLCPTMILCNSGLISTSFDVSNSASTEIVERSNLSHETNNIPSTIPRVEYGDGRLYADHTNTSWRYRGYFGGPSVRVEQIKVDMKREKNCEETITTNKETVSITKPCNNGNTINNR